MLRRDGLGLLTALHSRQDFWLLAAPLRDVVGLLSTERGKPYTDTCSMP